MMLTFNDTQVPYERFVNDVAQRVAEKLSTMPKNDFISQNEAFRRYGRANVERWLRKGKLHPRKRPGKTEYRISELNDVHNEVKQDYLG